MKNKLITILRIILPLFFWFALWQGIAMAIGHSFILPTIPDTVKALLKLVQTKSFYVATAMSLIRVVLGLITGMILGALFAILSFRVKIIKSLISPFVSVVKSTPIASIIIFLYVMVSGSGLAVAIAVLMVFPVIWQNVIQAFEAIPQELYEVCTSYEFTFKKKLKVLYFPILFRYFIPALITSVGLAWKATVSAEIIAYTKNSIGQFINDAKFNFNSEEVFAWTAVVIAMSIILERLTKFLLRRFDRCL